MDGNMEMANQEIAAARRRESLETELQQAEHERQLDAQVALHQRQMAELRASKQEAEMKNELALANARAKAEENRIHNETVRLREEAKWKALVECGATAENLVQIYGYEALNSNTKKVVVVPMEAFQSPYLLSSLVTKNKE